MKIRPRATTLACCVAAALAQMAVGSALADSAVGVDTALGNALNPSQDATRPLDPNGLSPFRQPAAHSPTGQLYNIPYLLPHDLHKTATGWEYSGQVEIGVLGGDANEKNAQFRMYKDLDNGLYLNNFGLAAEKPDEARFVEIIGGGVGKNDQYYGLQFGRYNDWKVKAFYSETPHAFTSTYGTLWSGIGTGNLTLLPPLTPGGSGLGNATDNANVLAVATASNSTLSVTRKKGGVLYNLNLSDSWKGYASYSLEHREGARPFGAVWGNAPGTAPTEIAEGIDNKTHELLAGLQYVDALNAFNLRLSASLFRNSIDTLTFQEPYRLFTATTNGIAPGGFTQGRFDLHPNNEAYNVKGEYARSLPDFYKGRFTGVLSLGTHRQDDNLIPYTTIPGVTLANVTGNNWNSTASLSRQSADARIDTTLMDLGLALNPTDALNLKGKLRFYQTDNKINPYLACNRNATYVDIDPNTAGPQPGALTRDGCTGVWGRILNDGTGSSVLMGASSAQAGNLVIKSIPFEYKQYNLGLGADYRLDKVSSLNAAYEREIYDREHRERDKTWEDKFKLGYVNRGLPDSTLRLSLEYGDRRGDSYNAAPYEEFVSAEFFPIRTGPAGTSVTTWAVHTNNALRKYDLADRQQYILNGRLNTMLRPDLDGAITLQLKNIDYPDSAYGRTKQYQNSINFDLNYQQSAARIVYAFYSFQQGRNDQANISTDNYNGVARTCNLGQVTNLGTITAGNAAFICASPGGPIYQLINAWSATSKDRNDVLGLGLKEDFGKARLDLNFIRSLGRNKLGYAYTPAGAVSVADAAFAGSGVPDIVIQQNIFDASLVVPVDKQVAVRLLYRYETGKIRDWHYQNIEGSPVVLGAAGAAGLPTAVILDGGPQDYKANVFGVLFQLKL
jgi:hypothetical protein